MFLVSRAPEPLDFVLALDDAILDMTTGDTATLWAETGVTLVEVPTITTPDVSCFPQRRLGRTAVH